MERFREVLSAEFFPYKALSETELDHLERHYELLSIWNQKINLTRITSVQDVVRFHYCESLYLGLKLPISRLAVADIGSGAGFPGIPLAIIRPECTVDLVESDQKKATFLREACRSIRNIRVLAVRAENVRTRYDWLVSRAVREEDVLRLGLAPQVALLTVGTDGERTPWGDRHSIKIVSRGTVSRETPLAD